MFIFSLTKRTRASQHPALLSSSSCLSSPLVTRVPARAEKHRLHQSLCQQPRKGNSIPCEGPAVRCCIPTLRSPLMLPICVSVSPSLPGPVPQDRFPCQHLQRVQNRPAPRPAAQTGCLLPELPADREHQGEVQHPPGRLLVALGPSSPLCSADAAGAGAHDAAEHGGAAPCHGGHHRAQVPAHPSWGPP